MSYPKPLSKKSLEKMYREADIDERKSEYLHKLFQSAVNLYGTIEIRVLWELCKETSAQYGITGLKRKDVINFSSIVRRETVPYYVFEIDELYCEEKRSDLDRMLVHNSLVGIGYGKLTWFYRLEEVKNKHPYYLPPDILEYFEPKETKYDRNLLNFLSRLKVTAKEVEISPYKTVKCEHYGEMLGKFSYMNQFDQFECKYYSGELENRPNRNEKILNEIARRNEGNEAEKLLRDYKLRCNIGGIGANPTALIEYVTRELNEVGVQLTMKQMETLLKLLMDVNNYSNLWCNNGWAPADIAKSMKYQPITEISLGPGIKKAIAEGKINLDDLEKECGKMGIKIF